MYAVGLLKLEETSPEHASLETCDESAAKIAERPSHPGPGGNGTVPASIPSCFFLCASIVLDVSGRWPVETHLQEADSHASESVTRLRGIAGH